MHPFFTEGAIEHGEFPELLLLEEVLRLVHRLQQIFKDITGLDQTGINNFNRQFCLNQYVQGFIQMFITWFPSHHVLPSWIFNASPTSYKHTAVGGCFHSLQRISSRTKDAANEIECGIFVYWDINLHGFLNN